MTPGGRGLDGLDAATRARLTRRSDLRGLAHLAGHLGIVGALGAAVVARAPGWPLAMLALGVATVFLFTLLHETVHRTPFASPWLNTWVGRLCGLAVVVPPLWFRHFHLAHHRHARDPARDPELGVAEPATRWQYLRHVSGLPAWRAQVATLLRNARDGGEDPFVPAAARPRVRREARVMLALYVLALAAPAAAGSTLAVTLWLVPVLLGQPFLRLYLLAEHAGCPRTGDPLRDTRTVRTGAAVRALAWNMPYHAEHHAFPGVPFHRLPELHARLAPRLAVVQDGYARFHLGLLRDLRGTVV